MYRKILTILVSLLFLSMSVMPPCGYADAVLPENPSFAHGSGTITINGQTMDITGMTNQAIIEWLSFCIAQGYTVNFHQPSAASFVLNRVTGGDPSSVMGSLISNGQVFLVNPNGILFGPSSYVNAPGLVASTLNISNDDFINGKFVFAGQGGSVINQGILSAPGGYVALLGNNIQNAGTIVSQLGTVALASGSKITLGLDPQGLISVAINEGIENNFTGDEIAIHNTGTISASGGLVLLSAKALDSVFKNAINNEGLIEANTFKNHRGSIYLVAEGDNAIFVNNGKILAQSKTKVPTPYAVDAAHSVDQCCGVDASGQGGAVGIKAGEIYIGGAIAAGDMKLDAKNNIQIDQGTLRADGRAGLRAGGDIILNQANIRSGINTYLSAGKDVLMSGSTMIYGGNLVNINAGNNIGLGLVQGHTVNLNAVAGSIFDNNGSATNIIANNATLRAAKGIGSGNSLETSIGNLQAVNLISGDINITNDANLTLKDLSGLGFAVSNLNGNIYINNSGDLNIQNDVISNLWAWLTAQGSINLHDASLSGAGWTYLWAKKDINLSGNASVSGSMISLLADNNFNMEGQASVTAGNIANITAGQDINMAGSAQINSGFSSTLIAGNNVNMQDQSAITSVNQTTIKAAQDVNLGLVQGQKVVVEASNGAIIDNNGSAQNIVADQAFLSAMLGIGSGNSLETSIGNLQATNATSGNIEINNISNADFYASLILNAGGNIDVTTLGDFLVGYIEGQNVALTSVNGSISDDFDSVVDIKANALTLTAAGDIGSPDMLELDVGSLTASAGGNLNIEAVHGALFSNIFAGGDINILTHGASILENIIGNGFVHIHSTLGNLTFNGSVSSTGSGVGITVDNGSIFANGPGPHIVANGDSFILAPLGKVTPTGNPLNVNINGDLLLDVSNLPITTPDGAIYANLIGVVNGLLNFPLVSPLSYPSPLIPPGFVYFNGIQIAPPINNGIYNQFAAVFAENLGKAYWENLAPYRYSSADPTTKTFYLYHPLRNADISAFDGIELDEDAYEFIDEGINLKQGVNPYFGSLSYQGFGHLAG